MINILYLMSLFNTGLRFMEFLRRYSIYLYNRA